MFSGPASEVVIEGNVVYAEEAFISASPVDDTPQYVWDNFKVTNNYFITNNEAAPLIENLLDSIQLDNVNIEQNQGVGTYRLFSGTGWTSSYDK